MGEVMGEVMEFDLVVTFGLAGLGDDEVSRAVLELDPEAEGFGGCWF